MARWRRSSRAAPDIARRPASEEYPRAATRGPLFDIDREDHVTFYEIMDPRFKALIDPVASLETLHEGNRWAEGPVYFADLRCLIWSDIPNERMLRWDEETGHVSQFRAHVPNANGNTRDREGRLITCEQGGRCVVRTEWDGSLTVLADRYRT